ncbi:hypothetical protein Trydic_g18811 [Trypoxylus dichotomus]
MYELPKIHNQPLRHSIGLPTQDVANQLKPYGTDNLLRQERGPLRRYPSSATCGEHVSQLRCSFGIHQVPIRYPRSLTSVQKKGPTANASRTPEILLYQIYHLM